MRIFDIDTIARFIGHPDIFNAMADDYSSKETIPQAAAELLAGGVWAVQPSETSLFMLFPRTVTMWEVHTMVMPEGRGKKAIADGRAGLLWLFENSPCEKVISVVPAFNRQALLFAKKVGFAVEGIITKSFRKNGALHDQALVGISKEDTCQQFQQQGR